jgi:hypothetical protein
MCELTDELTPVYYRRPWKNLEVFTHFKDGV